jgi:hypothetical protein
MNLLSNIREDQQANGIGRSPVLKRECCLLWTRPNCLPYRSANNEGLELACLNSYMQRCSPVRFYAEIHKGNHWNIVIFHVRKCALNIEILGSQQLRKWPGIHEEITGPMAIFNLRLKSCLWISNISISTPAISSTS